MTGFTLWDIVRNLLLAARWTVGLSLVTFVTGSLVGALVMLCRMNGNQWLRRCGRGYIELFQGTPLLMQLFLLFFGSALAGCALSPLQAAALALTLFASAYLADIWRGCIEAVPRGQWEASSSLAMTYFQQLRYVVAPQAIQLAIPPTVGFSVQIVKGTAVTSIIGFIELTKAGGVIANATFDPFTVYGFVALIYFCLCFPLSWWARRLERSVRGAHSH